MGADLVVLLGLTVSFAFFKVAAKATLLHRGDKNQAKRHKLKKENCKFKLLNIQNYQTFFHNLTEN